MKSVLLASQSKIKFEVVTKLFPPDQYTITCVDCDSCGLPAQPVNCVPRCARIRLNYAKHVTFPQIFDFYIAIENGIVGCSTPPTIVSLEKLGSVDAQEVCDVLIEHKGLLSHSSGNVILKVPVKYLSLLSTSQFVNLPHYNISGYNNTIGDFAHNDDPLIDSKNWIQSVYGISRTTQIESSLKDAMVRVSLSRSVAETIILKYKS